MSKIIAYLFDDDFQEVVDENQKPPLNTCAFLTEDYDVLDSIGNKITFKEIRKINVCENAVRTIHERRKQEISREILKNYSLIGELETKSQNANDKEYIDLSERVKENIDIIDKLNLKMYNLNALYETKYRNIRPPTPEIIYDTPQSLTPQSPMTQIPRSVTINEEPQYIYLPQPRMVQAPQSRQSESSGIIQKMGARISDVNGWDKDAVETVQNWRILLKEYKYIYEWILERNHKISTNLNLISVVSSSMMGCFSAFKLWIQDDRTFQATSDIIMLFSNFLIAAITTSSKRYIDDNRNEKIRNYLEEVSKFLGAVSAELIKSPEYRMNADQFIKEYQEIYSKLNINKPNITIGELTYAKKAYRNFENSFITFSSHETQTLKEGEQNV